MKSCRRIFAEMLTEWYELEAVTTPHGVSQHFTQLWSLVEAEREETSPHWPRPRQEEGHQTVLDKPRRAGNKHLRRRRPRLRP